jgi:hypothetical protein
VTVFAGYSAWKSPGTAMYGVTAILGVLTVVLWAIWWTATPPNFRVVSGLMHVHTSGKHETYDLSSPYLKVDVQRKPSNLRWKVVLEKYGEPPLVVNRSMVSPKEFMRVLDYYRRDL